MRKLLLHTYDVVGAVTLVAWAFAALDVPAGLPWWRVGIAMVCLSVAFTVVRRERT